jgi:hypothetical protein
MTTERSMRTAEGERAGAEGRARGSLRETASHAKYTAPAAGAWRNARRELLGDGAART